MLEFHKKCMSRPAIIVSICSITAALTANALRTPQAIDRSVVVTSSATQSDEKYDHKGHSLPLPEDVTFNAHIRGIMSNTCFACHGPDEEKNESGLRLDSYQAAVDEGEAIEPGDAQESTVYQRLMDQDNPMPPPEFLHRLSDYEIALFKKWIEQGAQYEEHWAYAPIRRRKPPAVKNHADLVRNPIDAFVFARLEREGFDPSPRADKATLLRRLSLDLVGLPPTQLEIESFLEDNSPNAYEKQVDRLLASPHYGERMAAFWLDLVRFSDTVGFHGDQNQRIFPYRDFVIDSLNSNQPFDEFTRDQLAGDLLENPSEIQLIATGLVRLNMMTREGGAQPEEYLAKYTADRVRMLGTAWLGSTTGCCECHNHKYDPFSIEDFYSLGAFFDDVRQWGVYTSYGYTPNPDLAGFNNDYPFPPELRLQSPSLQRQLQYLEERWESEAARLVDEKTLDSQKFKDWLAQFKNPGSVDHWQLLKPAKVQLAIDEPHKVLSDQSILFSGEPQASQQIVVEFGFDDPTIVRSLRMEVFPDAKNDGYVGRGENGSFSSTLSISNRNGLSPENQSVPIEIAFVIADRSNPKKFRNGRPPRYLKSPWRSGPIRWQLPIDEAKLPHSAVHVLNRAVELGPDDTLTIRVESADVGRIRFSVSPVARFVAGQSAVTDNMSAAIENLQGGKLAFFSKKQRNAVEAAYYQFITPFDKQSQSVKNLGDRIADCRSGLAMTLISQPLEKEDIPKARIFPRGNWQDKSGQTVQPNTPKFLPGYKDEPAKRLTRLDLANWLTSPQNPLTSRHFVNRVWTQFFGAGLSGKVDDLGNQGEWPSHPQLMDWLAAEFQDGWNRKKIVRLIVTSHSYQQQAAVNHDLRQTDPYNRLLGQQSARRLEAEIIRDNALAISGLINMDWIGGPSVFPYQPPGYYSNLQFPNRSYTTDTDGRQYRRGVYMHWQRTFLHPMLTNFDAPQRDECVAARRQSNSPQQALTLLNDPVFVESSRGLANRMLDESNESNIDSWITTGFRLAVARHPKMAELNGLAKLYEDQKKYFAANPAEAAKFDRVGQFQTTGLQVSKADFAALAQVCRVILNLHETITRY